MLVVQARWLLFVNQMPALEYVCILPALLEAGLILTYISLSGRKKAKLQGQYKGLMKGAKRGAQAGKRHGKKQPHVWRKVVSSKHTWGVVPAKATNYGFGFCHLVTWADLCKQNVITSSACRLCLLLHQRLAESWFLQLVFMKLCSWTLSTEDAVVVLYKTLCPLSSGDGGEAGMTVCSY